MFDAIVEFGLRKMNIIFTTKFHGSIKTMLSQRLKLIQKLLCIIVVLNVGILLVFNIVDVTVKSLCDVIYSSLHLTKTSVTKTSSSDYNDTRIVFNICDVTVKSTNDVIHSSLRLTKTSSSEYKDTRILLQHKYCMDYLQNGAIFHLGREVFSEGTVSVCYLMSFSSIVEKEFSEKFLNVFENVTSWVKSPSIVRHNNVYYVTLRIRLKPAQMPNNKGECWEYRCTLNYIYLMKFDQHFTPIGKGEVVAIPTPQGRFKNINGAHDARLFTLTDGLFALLSVNFDNSWVSVIWDFQAHKPYMPNFQKELLQMGKIISEKNWVPLVINNTLYIIRHLDPMHVLKSSTLNSCKFIRNETDALTYKMKDKMIPLRGGTGFEEYQYPYYIGIGHSTNFRNKTRVYRAHIVLFCVEPEFRIVE